VRATRLDHRLLEKMAKKLNKSQKYLREQISKRASRRGITSEAAQILWAKELGLGTAHYQRRQEPHIQLQVRELLPTVFADLSTLEPSSSGKKARAPKQKSALTAAIEYLLIDTELRARCMDLLRAKGKFDRVFREASTVLDDRLRKLSSITDRKCDPAELAARLLHPNNAILRVSQDKGEQEGFFLVCKGIFLAFRNPTHHQLTDKFTRENALQFCAFVDSLLAALGKAERQP